MHMPGHKRVMRPSDILPYEWDITEIEGADDLHDADGILKEAMDRASELWKSRRTWFLVGGSTCGLLAAIRAAAPFGSEIIAARNCHRSVYHAIELGGYKVHWILPEEDRSFDVCLDITPEQVRACLRRYPDSAAVIVTSGQKFRLLSMRHMAPISACLRRAGSRKAQCSAARTSSCRAYIRRFPH